VWAQADLRKVLGTVGARVIEGEVAVGRAHERFDEQGFLHDDDLRDQLRKVTETLVATAAAREPAAVAA
jgi:chromate reductase